MDEAPKRQLAAIMFADMVGYTALMQEDEERARAQRDRQREVLSSMVPRHRGQILQYYGDGTLSIFNSAVEAVECAVEIQLEIQKKPEVPLRIAVHTGDIVHEKDGVYGDGLNVAARIEALSAPGGVLISGKVFDEIKNHSSLSTVSLGKVQLRGVKHPVGILAVTNEGLSVPKEDDVHAKASAGARETTVDTRELGSGSAGQPSVKPGVGEAFLKHAKRRSIFQWGVAYLATAWAFLEVMGFVGRRFQWPTVIPQRLALLAFVGFFVALVVTWYHGEKGRQRVQATEISLITLLLLVGGVALTMLRPEAPESASSQPAGLGDLALTDSRPSVAVLPFANLSAAEENAYFASGLHDEVITQLQRVSGLRVISRTSVMGYASDRPNVREIARNLGVTHVVEASVQRIGDRLRVNVQLIDARTDDHVWAELYDRDLDDAFAVQSDIARVVAASMATTLTVEERGAIALAPTENPEAYRFYLQGNDYSLRPGYRQDNSVAAEGLYAQAVALDPEFALARAALSMTHGTIYWENFDPSSTRLDAQREEADAALRLDPTLPEAHEAVGWVHYVGGDYQRALQEYEIALEGLPSDADIVGRIGYTHRRLGNWPEVFAAFDRATELNPRNATLFYDLGGHSFIGTRRYAEAIGAYQTALTLAPDLHDAAISRGNAYVHWQGQLDTLRAVMDGIPGELHLPEVDRARADLAHWSRDPEGLLLVLEAIPAPVFETQLVYFPKSLYVAWAHRLGGNEPAARVAFDSARLELEALSQRRPDDGRLVAALGYAYAGLGMRDEAARAAETFTQARQRAGTPQGAETASRILAQANLSEQAAHYLEILLQGDSPISARTLALDPLYDPIRQTPVFQEVLERYGSVR